MNQSFVQGTVNECDAQHWLQRFSNEDENHEKIMEIFLQLRVIIEGDPFKITGEVAEEH